MVIFEHDNTKTSNQYVTDAMRYPLIGDCLLVKNKLRKEDF